MVTGCNVLYKLLLLSFSLIQTGFSSNFAEPAFEEGPAGSVLNKRVGNYKVTTDSTKWKPDTAANLSSLPVTVENSCACGTISAWIDEKSVIYILNNNSTRYKTTGFTDPHALSCNPQCTSIFFVSMDHVYRFNIASQKCEVILSASGIGSGGAKILCNAKYAAVSYRRNTLNVIYIIDIKSMKSRLCFQTSNPISHLEINDIGLFFYSEDRLYRYLLK